MTKSIVQVPFDEIEKFARAALRSRYFSDVTDVAQAIIKIQAGAEIGLPKFASLAGIHIIKGKPVLGANLIATLIKNDARYDYRVKNISDAECSIEFFENGKLIGVSTFTTDDARRAGVKNMDRFPRNMLFARAISNGAKWFTPGIFGGAPVYTPDELGMETDADGHVIDVPADAVTHPAPVVSESEHQQQDEERPSPPNSNRPYAPAAFRDALHQAAQTQGATAPYMSDPKLWQRVAALIDACLPDGLTTEHRVAARHMVQEFLFGVKSLNDAEPRQVAALAYVLDGKPPGAAGWDKPDGMAVREIDFVYRMIAPQLETPPAAE